MTCLKSNSLDIIMIIKDDFTGFNFSFLGGLRWEMITEIIV